MENKPKSWRKYAQAVASQIFFMWMCYKTHNIEWAIFVCISAGIFAMSDVKIKRRENSEDRKTGLEDIQ